MKRKLTIDILRSLHLNAIGSELGDDRHAEFDHLLDEIRAAAWDEGFKACAEWWEIHHWQFADGSKANPYRSTYDAVLDE